MLTIEMLPARHGDCLWIEYGTGKDVHRILIDGGPGFTYPVLRARIERLPKTQRHFELLVISHIDADHIEGIIRLLGDPTLGVTYDDVWYNAWPQIAKGQMPSFGAESGEMLAALIPELKLPWNRAFGQTDAKPAAAMLGRPPVVLPGGAKLTLLSPTGLKLDRLRADWDKELAKLGLDPDSPEEALARLKTSPRFKGVSFDVTLNPVALAATPFTGDKGSPNGSSIAFLLEAGGKRLLALADAHADVIEAGINTLISGTGKLTVDAIKLPHHGSENNVSSALVARIATERWLFSSDGSIFNHPDPESVSRVIMGAERPQLLFNYRSERTAIWDDAQLKRRHRYRTTYPAAGTAGIVVKL